MEYKAIPHYTEQIDGRTVIGFASITGNIDDGMDRTWSGAFKKTLQEQKERVRHLWMHDAHMPPTAAIKDIREVGRADLPDDLKKKYPDATGALLVEREYLNTERGNEILEGIRSDAINEMSFGYDPIRFDFEEHPKVKGTTIRNLRELRLYDTSDVLWGMNAATLASKFADLAEYYKHFTDNQQVEPPEDEPIDPVDEFIRAASGIDPDALKAGRVLSSANIEKLKRALETLSGILAAAEPEDDDEGKAETPTPAKVDPLTDPQLAARYSELQRLVKRLQN